MGITVENLRHIYNENLAYETLALDDVSFKIEDSEFIGIIGRTGSGKSTLIQHLNGLLKPNSGKILINEIDLSDDKKTMVDIRKKIGLVFQYPEYQLFEETVYLDVAFGPKNLSLEEDEIDKRVREALALVGLDFEDFKDRSPFELSGGQKRRVAIAGVLAMRPEILILDEPTAGLDPRAHKNILNMICDIKVKQNMTVVLVSHNMDDVADLSDRVFVMHDAKLVKQGLPEEVFKEKEYLNSIGLGLPRATDFLYRLEKETGVRHTGTVLTKEQLEDLLYEKLSSKND